MKINQFLKAAAVSLALLFPVSAYAQQCMNLDGLKAAIVEHMPEGTEIYQSMTNRVEAEAFMVALYELAPQMPPPPAYDEIHIVPDGLVAIVVVMKDGCVQGAARVPTHIYFAAKRMYQTASDERT
jgi:hypothetical protein